MFAGGVEPIVVQFERNASEQATAQQWIKTVVRAQHTHDVRALACTETELVSAGQSFAITEPKLRTFNMRCKLL